MIKPKSLEKGPYLKPLSKKTFKKEAKAALRLAFGPQERLIKGEIKGSRLAQKRAKDYFKTYGREVAGAGKTTAAAYDSAQAGITAASNTTADRSEAIRQRMAAEAQADAERRGVTYNPSGSVVGAEANLARVNAANVLSAVTGAQKASNQGYYADKGRIGDREGIEQQFREEARRRSLKGELKTLSADKAAQVAGMLATARDSERDFYLGLQAAREPFRDRAFDASQAAKDRKLQRNQAQKDRHLDRGQAHKDRQHGGTDSSSGGKDGDGRDAADVKKALGIIKREGNLNDHSKQEWIEVLLGIDASFSPNEIKRALALAKKRQKPGEIIGGAAGGVGGIFGGGKKH